MEPEDHDLNRLVREDLIQVILERDIKKGRKGVTYVIFGDKAFQIKGPANVLF